MGLGKTKKIKQPTLLVTLKKIYLKLIDQLLNYKDYIIHSINSKKNLNNNQQDFIGLITRCKDEYFIKEFCDYYIKQGIDKIYIIDDNSHDKSIYKSLEESEKIDIIYESNIIEKNYANQLYKKIRYKFEWIIYVDVDEFITTKKNIKNSIREELRNTFKDIHCIKVPWVMMSCDNIKKSPDSILKTNIYRWNHDKKHPNKIHKFRCRYDEIEVKCIFRPKYFNNIWDHHPKSPVHNPKITNSINLHQEKLNPFYTNLREKDIKNGILLCYHYRIISVENSINKIKTNYWYKKNNYTVNDLMDSDNAEMIDNTIKDK